jgi:5S rRNA maturation endonuclease (ribonuclease M5)
MSDNISGSIFDTVNARLDQVFQTLGLVTPDGNPVCPSCGAYRRGQVSLKKIPDAKFPSWKCFKCGLRGTGVDAAILVQKLDPAIPRNAKIAAEMLLGKRPFLIPVGASSVTIPLDTRKSRPDYAVYKQLLEMGSIEGAIEFWGQWHILPEAVREVGSVLIDDPKGAAGFLTRKFGLVRLQKCGLVAGKSGNWFLFGNGSDNANYGIIEPQKLPDGRVSNVQFRAYGATAEAALEHKKWSRSPEKENLPEVKYTPRFVSLASMPKASQVGYGLPRLNILGDDKRVYIVEGCKDLLAARSMGFEAYAIAGIQALPPEVALETLRRFDLVAMLDGDDAGEAGRQLLVEHLKNHGIVAASKSLRSGYDMADVLVERSAHNNCQCYTCKTWRKEHPYDQQTCQCVSCYQKRVPI